MENAPELKFLYSSTLLEGLSRYRRCALAVATFASGLVISHAGTWTQVSYIYNEANRSFTKMSVTNTGTVTITVQAGSASETRTQWVTGAAQTTPPVSWSSKFDPLVQQTVTHSVSWWTQAVPPKYTYRADLLWVYEVGSQKFQYSENGVTVQRDRDWWRPNGSAVLLIPPPPPQPGGGGG